MDTVNSIKKANHLKELEDAKAQLESANYRFNSESGKNHPNDPTAKETFANKIKANKEQIEVIDKEISELKKKEKKEDAEKV